MTRKQARKAAEELVSRMTVEEMAGQLRFDAGEVERIGIPAYNWWNEALHGVARGGTATVFPQAIGMAARIVQNGKPHCRTRWKHCVSAIGPKDVILV